MRTIANLVLAAGIALGVSMTTVSAQQAAQLKPGTPAAMAAAREILAMKNVSAMFSNAVPNIVQRTKDTLVQTNLNYQKDLNEVALVVAKDTAGREKEIAEQMAKIYANDFTEQELKDLVTFYKSPLGQKLLAQEPKSIAASMQYMNQWAQSFAEEVNGKFRAEMRKRGKEI